MKKLLALAFALMLIFSVALADEPLTIAVSMRSTAFRKEAMVPGRMS